MLPSLFREAHRATTRNLLTLNILPLQNFAIDFLELDPISKKWSFNARSLALSAPSRE